jgi:rhodanese-related sulfurtransferase
MNADELLSKIDAGSAPLIVDVRTAREFSRGHVPGAINAPLSSLLAGTVALPRAVGEPVVLYCGHGPRARMAAVLIRRAGFHHIQYLKGHMANWRKSGLREER